MLTVMRDAQRRLEVACEWWLVDEQGHWTPRGQYVFLHQLEVNAGVNLHAVRKHLVSTVSLAVPGALGVFWKREHDAYPRVHAFRRSQLQQLQEEVRV